METRRLDWDVLIGVRSCRHQSFRDGREVSSRGVEINRSLVSVRKELSNFGVCESDLTFGGRSAER